MHVVGLDSPTTRAGRKPEAIRQTAERGIAEHLQPVRFDKQDRQVGTNVERGDDEAPAVIQVGTRQQFLRFALSLFHQRHLLFMGKSVECKTRHFCLMI